MDSILVQDVCEVYLKELGVTTPKEYFYGLTTSSAVNQSVNQEMLRAGIGNGVVGVIQSEKEITFSVATLFHNDSLFEVQNGDAFASGDITVVDSIKGVGATTTTITLSEKVQTGTVGKISILKADGSKLALAGDATLSAVDNTVTATGATFVVGERYTVLIPRTTTGNILTLQSDKFPKNYQVQLHTIAYDVDKNTVVADIYWIFSKALPNGALSGNYEAGSNAGNEVEFTAMLPVGSKVYGQYVVIPRV